MQHQHLHSELLLLPGEPGFYEWLHCNIPPGTQAYAYVVRTDGSGLLEPVSEAQLDEYLEGGEYDERLTQIGEDYGDYYG